MALWGAEELVKSEPRTREVLRNEPFSWPLEVVDGIGTRMPFMVGVTVRCGVEIPVAAIVGFGIPILRGYKPEQVRERRRAMLTALAVFIVLFFPSVAYGLAFLKGWIRVPLFVVFVGLSSVQGAIGIPAIMVMFASLFPKNVRWRATLFALMELNVAMFVYWAWRFLSMVYFSFDTFALRVFIGVFAPALLASTAFELFYPFALVLLKHATFHSAAMFMVVPMIFGMCVSATMSLGSDSFHSGFCIELGSMFCEVNFKYALLSGETPMRQTIRWLRDLRAAFRVALAKKRGTVAPDTISVVPTRGYSADAFDSAESARDAKPTPADPEGGIKDLCAVVALYADAAEIIVQLISAGFFVMARLNPNAAAQPPSSPERVFALLAVRVCFELATDFIVANIAATLRPERYAAARDHIATIGTLLRLDICLLATVWAIDVHTFFAMFLCPYPKTSGDPPLFTSIFGSPDVLSLGLCV